MIGFVKLMFHFAEILKGKNP